jgi:hypothetical protein
MMYGAINFHIRKCVQHFREIKTSYLTRLEQGTFVGKNPDNQNSINGQTDDL